MEGRVCCTQFWLRRLHSFTGFIFLGYFLSFHVRGLGSYQSSAARVLFLFLPFSFHGLYGLFLTYESRPNALRYSWVRNWMYLMQRATGLVLVPFVPIHIGAMEWGAAYANAAWYRVFWYVGLLAAVSHLANGIFGTAIDWGVTVGPHSQKVFVKVCFVVFVVLAGYGLYTLRQF